MQWAVNQNSLQIPTALPEITSLEVEAECKIMYYWNFSYINIHEVHHISVKGSKNSYSSVCVN